jgi:homoserine kinase
VRVPLAVEPAVVMWVPSFTTSTDQSRTILRDTVSFADAVFNVGRTALLVAALASGDVGALRTATEDRLHQDARFARSLPSHEALASALRAGAWCGWLSGSGPSVAVLCDPADAERIAVSYPNGASVKVLAVDQRGAVVI